MLAHPPCGQAVRASAPRRSPRRLALLAALALTAALFVPGRAAATPRFVATTGDDFSAGTIDTPWRSLWNGIARLAPGDTLYIRGGVYHQWNLQASVSGTADAPIVIRAYPGEKVTVDTSFPEFRTPRNAGWRLVDPSIGHYITRSSVDEFVVTSWVTGMPGYENERIRLTPFHTPSHFTATTDAYDPGGFYTGPGALEGSNHLEVRLAKTADMRLAEQRYGRVFDEDVPNPADYSIVTTGASTALLVRGSYLVFKDLELETGYDTIWLAGGIHHVVFDGLTVWIGRTGIKVGGPGVHHVTVTRSKIFGDCPPWIFRSDVDSDVLPSPASRLRSTSIDLAYGTHDWEISYNHIRGSAQYLIEGRSYLWDPGEPLYNVFIHHNRLENAAEDALHLDNKVRLGRVEVYENFVSNCLRAVAAGQYAPVFDGPLLIYRNVVALLRDPPVNRTPGLLSWNGGSRNGYEYLFRLSGAGFTTANTHVYHNTLALLNSASKGINLLPQLPADGRFANNLMIVVNGRVNGGYPSGSGCVVDGNLYWKLNTVDAERLTDIYDTVGGLFSATGLEQHGLGAVPKRGTDPQLPDLHLEVVDPMQTRWALTASSERTQPWNYVLGAASPARGAGIAIPPHPTLGMLPDTRSSRDIGALPYGTQASDFAFFPFDPVSNQAPLVNAGPDQTQAPPGDVLLQATVSDDGHPTSGALIARWRKVSGPGAVRFENPNAVTTRASFSVGGTYALELTASDGEKTSTDLVQITSAVPFQSLDKQVSAGNDDAEEGGPNTITASGGTLHLGYGKGASKTIGLRFTGLEIPRGATVLRAYVQLTSYGAVNAPATITIRGQADDDAEPFAATFANITSRPQTQAAVDWNMGNWGAHWSAGPAERTSDLAPIIQEIVDRAGWNSGNDLALILGGGPVGTTHQAISLEYGEQAAAWLHVDFVQFSPLDVTTEPALRRLRATVSPNPTIRTSTLRFVLPRSGPARAELFDVRGRLVRLLLDSPRLEAGAHKTMIGSGVAPGVYFYRVRAGGEVATGRCLLLR